MWCLNEDDCQSCHHEVTAYLREYSHQDWVSSQVGLLREYTRSRITRNFKCGTFDSR